MTSHRLSMIALLTTLCVSCAIPANAIAAKKGELVNSKGEALIKNKFTGTSGEVKFETTGKLVMTCSASSLKGVMTSKTKAEETVTYTGCESLGKSCTGTGSKTGELKIGFSASILFSILPPFILPSASILFNFGFKCGTISGTLTGNYITPLPESQQEILKKEYTYVATEKNGIQEPDEIEHSKGEKVKEFLVMSLGGGKEQAGINQSQKVTYEEEAKYI